MGSWTRTTAGAPRSSPASLAFLRERPELGGCVTEVMNVWDDDAGGAHYADHPRAGVIPGYATISLLVSRAAWEKVGPLREDLGMPTAPSGSSAPARWESRSKCSRRCSSSTAGWRAA